MNLHQLNVFVRTVELKKLYLVAQALDITQPTVTFHLNKLHNDMQLCFQLQSSIKNEGAKRQKRGQNSSKNPDDSPFKKEDHNHDSN